MLRLESPFVTLMGHPFNTGRFAEVLVLVGALGTAGCAAESPDAGAAQEPAAGGAPTVEFVSSDLTGDLGLPFSEAVRVNDLILVSGMVGTKPGALELVAGGLEAESRQALENIATILESAGATPEDIVKCTVMMDDIGQWGAFNEVYVNFFGDHRPARSAFGADGLALGAAVEIECIAVATEGRR